VRGSQAGGTAQVADAMRRRLRQLNCFETREWLEGTSATSGGSVNSGRCGVSPLEGVAEDAAPLERGEGIPFSLSILQHLLDNSR
jgi:hypothetical protein